MRKPDLHMHTTASDGVLSPRELVDFAAARGVTLMAVTDHDTIAGADSLRGETLPIPVLTGVEMSMTDMKGLHLLGYGVTDAQELRATVKALADKRVTRAERMVERLNAMGIALDCASLRAKYHGSLGRAHMAREMVEMGYVRHVTAAFDKYLGEDKPAYIPNEGLSMAEAIALLRRNGFVPVLAHPAELEQKPTVLRMLIEAWQAQGLMGVEVYHPSQQKHGFAALDAAVRRMGLLVTGGSDYHTNDNRHGQPGGMAAYWANAADDAARLMEAMQKQADTQAK